MTYQPVVPFGGNAGWEFLQRTRDRQQAAFESSAVIVRNTDRFRERIGTIGSAEELIQDRALLQVALGAFGLDEDLNNKYLIQKVLESDTTSRDSLTSRFADKRYQAFSEAFGFGSPLGPATANPGFADRIIEAYNTRQFEIAVGNQSTDLRLALGLERELETINSKAGLSDDAAWFSVMANKPLRSVLEKAMGLPVAFGTLDLDRQLSTFRERSEQIFGVSEVSGFADPEVQEELRRLFLVRAQLEEGNTAAGSASIALSLLTQAAQFNR
ncbi:DUF1217 domain-containing protein [Maribius pontilimi]|uniref:DUF1217 domain-containing protein n=1 Tax=Palleronia pontilimi TaxID=1964209 RepID=A0A934MA25_9RHOB|nr:DUF1217 domain-containing protein [Palleronia pontilimi]MBJ3763172.1 DUF1217 domain-containing protein [Palleronia pontilimi]